MHGRQTQYLAPLHLPQLTSNHTVQSRPDWLTSLVDKYAGIVVKLDHTTVWPLQFLGCSNDDGMTDVSSADFIGGGCTDRASRACFGAEVSLLLDNDDYAIAWSLLDIAVGIESLQQAQ